MLYYPNRDLEQLGISWPVIIIVFCSRFQASIPGFIVYQNNDGNYKSNAGNICFNLPFNLK